MKCLTLQDTGGVLNLSCPLSPLAIFSPCRSPQRLHLPSPLRPPHCSVLTPWVAPPSFISQVSSAEEWQQGQGSCWSGPEAGGEGAWVPVFQPFLRFRFTRPRDCGVYSRGHADSLGPAAEHEHSAGAGWHSPAGELLPSLAALWVSALRWTLGAEASGEVDMPCPQGIRR